MFLFFCRWEQERVRQEHLALERWRQEAREHEKQVIMVKTGLTGFSFMKPALIFMELFLF